MGLPEILTVLISLPVAWGLGKPPCRKSGSLAIHSEVCCIPPKLFSATQTAIEVGPGSYQSVWRMVARRHGHVATPCTLILSAGFGSLWKSKEAVALFFWYSTPRHSFEAFRFRHFLAQVGAVARPVLCDSSAGGGSLGPTSI